MRSSSTVQPGVTGAASSAEVSATTSASGRDPSALGELFQRRRHKVVGVGRIHEDKVERRAEASGFRSKIGRRAPMNARGAEKLKGLDVVADAAAGGAVGLDEQTEGRAARDRLETQRAGAGEGVDHPRAFKRRRPFGVGQHVEDGLPRAVGGRPRLTTFRAP